MILVSKNTDQPGQHISIFRKYFLKSYIYLFASQASQASYFERLVLATKSSPKLENWCNRFLSSREVVCEIFSV